MAYPFHPIKREDIEQTLVQRFGQQVSRYPDRLALKTSAHAITYSVLNRLANRVAGVILSRCKPEGKPIAIVIEDYAAAIIALLGVLKSGHIYLPLNYELPRVRLHSILQDSTARTILTCNQQLSLTQSLVDGLYHEIVNIDNIIDNIAADVFDENSCILVASSDLAHIVYTSGSTGVPKGVCETHRNIIHHVMRVTNSACYSPEDRMTLLRPPNSGGALMNVYSALLNGASLFPFDLRNQGIDGLNRLLRDEKITVYHSNATVFRQFLRTLDRGVQFPHLRLIRLGSEQLLKKDIELYRNQFPSSKCAIVNSLNCTEANTLRQYFIEKDSDISGNIVPVGYAVDDMKIFLTDECGNEVSWGETGEVAVTSRYLSPGYWRKPELTRAAFLADEKSDERIFLTGDVGRMRRDGCLEYIGRKDSQVKIRGHKVQMDEVEAGLLSVTGIERAAVVACTDENGDQRVIAYLVLKHDRKLTCTELLNELRPNFPSYMLPRMFIVLHSLPITANGKTDRRALPPPPRTRPEVDELYVSPCTPIETVLTRIWSDSLKLDQVGVNDHLMEIGADSLLASGIISKVNRIFSVDLPPSVLVRADTVATLSKVLIEQTQNAKQIDAIARMWLKIDAFSDAEVRRVIKKERERGNVG